MPEIIEDNQAERLITQAEWEQIQLNNPKKYISLTQASELSKIAKSTIRDRAKAGKYRYIRIRNSRKTMIFYRQDFDSKYVAPAEQERKKEEPSGSVDLQLKVEKLRKIRRENDFEEGKLISVLEVQNTHRELFRLMFSDLRETIDKWGITHGLSAEVPHKMNKDFDKVVQGVAKKLAERYN